MSTAKSLSVVIPAHQEELCIADTLSDLQKSLGIVQAEVVVVCNGCTDDTYARASEHSLKPTVIDSDVASKSLAIRVGESHCNSFPRIYLDADVSLAPDAMTSILASFAETDVPLVAARSWTNCSGSSWMVRKYYEFWQLLPYVADEGVGSGLYALSELGRARFGEFPEVIADDEFVRRHFSVDEITVLERGIAKVDAPPNLTALINTKTRGRIGAYQLTTELAPKRTRTKFQSVKIALDLMTKNPDKLGAGVVYLLITVVIRVRSTVLHFIGKRVAWSQSSREKSRQD